MEQVPAELVARARAGDGEAFRALTERGVNNWSVRRRAAYANRSGEAAGSERILETSVPGIFAAGDVRSGSIKRCAAAVGEGSMAVQLVHAHLAAAPEKIR